MSEIDYPDLQRRFGGRFVARRGATVILSAETYDGLSDQIMREALAGEDLVVELVEPNSAVNVY